jgi:hypothetical protein
MGSTYGRAVPQPFDLGAAIMAPTVFRTVVISVLSSAVTTMVLYNVQIGTLDTSAVLAPMQRTVRCIAWFVWFAVVGCGSPRSTSRCDVLFSMQFGWQPSLASSYGNDSSIAPGPPVQAQHDRRSSMESLRPSFAPQVRMSSHLTPEEVRALHSTYNCRRMGAWGDICTYENVCYDGSFLYFLEPGAAQHPKDTAAFYCDADLYEGLIFPRREGHDRRENRLPFNGGKSLSAVAPRLSVHRVNHRLRRW